MTDNLFLAEISNKLSDVIELLQKDIEVNRITAQQLTDEADIGKALYNNGTLSATLFTIIDTQISPGHNVKGYTIRNTGLTNLYFAHNIVKEPQIDADIVDTLKTSPIFSVLVPNEVEHTIYNRRVIKSVHLAAVTGTPTYKIKLIW